MHRKRHIGFESLVELMPQFVQKIIMSCVYLLLIYLNIVLIRHGWRLTTELGGETTVTLLVPIGIIYAVMPVTAVLMFLMCAIQMGQIWTDGKGGKP